MAFPSLPPRVAPNPNAKTRLGLTKPKETKGADQNHFFLILCENLPVPAMVSDDASKA